MNAHRLISESGINTDEALKIYAEAEAIARGKATVKAKKKEEDNAEVIQELGVKLKSLLFPEDNRIHSVDVIKNTLEKLLDSSSVQCNTYYSASEIVSDLQYRLQNKEQYTPYYTADIAKQLMQALAAEENKFYSAKDILQKLNIELSSLNQRYYDANDVAKALNELLMQKRAVAYADEEIADELKELLHPVILDMSNDILDDYQTFYDMVYHWDVDNIPGSDQQKCATVQQIFLIMLEDVKDINSEILEDEYRNKISGMIKYAYEKKRELTGSGKDQETIMELTHKISVMNAMLVWLKNKMTLAELQASAGECYLYYKNLSSIDTNALFNELVAFRADHQELEYFKKSQPLINEICKRYDEIASSDTSDAGKSKQNILLAMKYCLTGKACVIRDDGYPEIDNTGSMNIADILKQAITLNPDYKAPYTLASSSFLFSKTNEIDLFLEQMENIKFSPVIRNEFK